MVDEVIKAFGDWELLDRYIDRTKHLALGCIPSEEGVVVFLDYDPWILNLPTTVIDGKTYIPAQK
jgi:hypothetical protein